MHASLLAGRIHLDTCATPQPDENGCNSCSRGPWHTSRCLPCQLGTPAGSLRPVGLAHAVPPCQPPVSLPASTATDHLDHSLHLPPCQPPLSGAQLAVKLTAHDSDAVDELLQSVSTLVLDCDGVLWVGDALVPGTVAALQRFRQLGKRLLFLTNNSSKSRRLYRAKFASLDIAVAPEEIVPTSYTAAAYLQSRNFKKKVYLIGTDGVGEELAAAGIEHVTWQELVGSPTATNGAAEMQREWTAASFGRLQLDQSIGAVVVGWDPNFSYSSMCCAAACLRELPGCEFVATNLDPADNMGARFEPCMQCMFAAQSTSSAFCVCHKALVHGSLWFTCWCAMNRCRQWPHDARHWLYRASG